MSENITITVSHDEALVLFEFFSRFGDTDDFRLRNNAEYVAFQKISAQLDKSISDMFKPNYVELLCIARERIAGDYDGLAPGVTNDAT
jgi:hypothetical protein